MVFEDADKSESVTIAQESFRQNLQLLTSQELQQVQEYLNQKTYTDTHKMKYKISNYTDILSDLINFQKFQESE